jgi:hypothetical protein
MAYNPDVFVNRDAEITVFRALLTDAHKHILLVLGDEGMGKTCVLQRLHQECGGATGPKPVLVDFRGKEPLIEPDQVIRRLRERIGGDFAAQLGRVVVGYTEDVARAAFSGLVASLAQAGTGGSVQFTNARNIEIKGDLVGGVKFSIDNSTVVINPGGGPEVAQSEIETRLNTDLPDALQAFQSGQPLALFFDHFESTTQIVAAWIQEHLLNLLLESQARFPNLWIIIAGRQVPMQAEAADPQYALQLQRLDPLSEEAIITFWVDKCGLDPADAQQVITECEGNPLLMVWKANDAKARLARGR